MHLRLKRRSRQPQLPSLLSARRRAHCQVVMAQCDAEIFSVASGKSTTTSLVHPTLQPCSSARPWCERRRRRLDLTELCVTDSHVLKQMRHLSFSAPRYPTCAHSRPPEPLDTAASRDARRARAVGAAQAHIHMQRNAPRTQRAALPNTSTRAPAAPPEPRSYLVRAPRAQRLAPAFTICRRRAHPYLCTI